MGDQLADNGRRRIHDALARHVDLGRVPGAVGAVSCAGEVHIDQTGTTAFGDAPPMERDSIFRIASITKPIVAAATMSLVEDGLLRLDDPVDDLLPELADRRVLRSIDGPVEDTVPAERPITTRDLLTLTWGIGHVLSAHDPYPVEAAVAAAIGAPGPPAPGERTLDPDAWMRALGTLPLMDHPGRRWLYHNGFEVLGVLLARADGRELEQVLRERILDPLGMVDTSLSRAPDGVDRLVTAYLVDQESGEPVLYDEPGGGWASPPLFPDGGGGLLSTADDVLAFGEMLLGHGTRRGQRVLSRASVELMTCDQLDEPQKQSAGGVFDESGYGFGLGMTTRRREIYDPVGRFGWDGGLGAGFACDPGGQVVTVLMTQVAWFSSAGPPAVLHDFRTAIYAGLED